MTGYDLLYDEDELKRFHNVLSENGLASGEAYFVSLSARKKYLEPKERLYYDLNRAEMFARKLVKDNSFETYRRTVRSMEVSYGGYTTKSDKTIPEKALVVYAQLNPVSGKQALREFYQKTNDALFDMATNPEAVKNLAKLDTLLMNCYQRSRGSNNLLDVDFDTKETKYVDRFLDVLRSHNVDFWVVDTRSGYHVLMAKNTVKFNYPAEVQKLDTELKEKTGDGEVVVNKNQMVPLPGTLQGRYKVKML